MVKILSQLCSLKRFPHKFTSNSPLIHRFLPAPIGISEETTISMGIKSRSDSLKMATHKYKSATSPSLWDKCSSGHVSKTIWVKLSLRTLSISVTVFRSQLSDLRICNKKIDKYQEFTKTNLSWTEFTLMKKTILKHQM